MLITWPIKLFNNENIILTLYWLTMFSDQVLAYKTMLLTTTGNFVMVMLNLAFKDGRPFWDIKDVYSNGQCIYMFGSPDFMAFNATFLYLYMICIYLFKYNRSPYAVINISASILTALLFLNLYLESYANGVTYIYQLVIGQLCGFVYLIACLTFDDEIHKYCERAGFIVRSSRSRKFHILFLSLGSFIFIMAYYSALSLWRMPLLWIVNANNKEDSCQKKYESTGLNNLGINATFA